MFGLPVHEYSLSWWQEAVTAFEVERRSAFFVLFIQYGTPARRMAPFTLSFSPLQ